MNAIDEWDSFEEKDGEEGESQGGDSAGHLEVQEILLSLHFVRTEEDELFLELVRVEHVVGEVLVGNDGGVFKDVVLLIDVSGQYHLMHN